MSRICDLTGKKSNNANQISHSNIKTKKTQMPNLHVRRLWLDEEKRYVVLKISTRALRTIRKKGLSCFAREVGIDLSRY